MVGKIIEEFLQLIVFKLGLFEILKLDMRGPTTQLYAMLSITLILHVNRCPRLSLTSRKFISRQIARDDIN